MWFKRIFSRRKSAAAKLTEYHAAMQENNSNKDEVMARLILKQLRCHPSLIYEYYDDGHGESYDTLHLFLKRGVALEYVQELLQICPNHKKVLKRAIDGYLPIHSACQYSTPDVMEYIMHHQRPFSRPGLVLYSHGLYLLPVHLALVNTRQVVPCSTLRDLIHFSAKSAFPEHWSGLLCLALMTDQSPETLEMLVDEIPWQGELADLDSDDHMPLLEGRGPVKALSLVQAMALARLFDKLDKAEFYYAPVAGWDADAFMYMMGRLEKNRRTFKLDYLTLPNLNECCRNKLERALVLKAFERFLANNTTMTDFSVNLKEQDSAAWQTWYKAIDRGLASNTTMSTVRFNCLYEVQNDDEPSTMKRAVLYWERSDDISVATAGRRSKRLLLDGFELTDKGFADRLEWAPDNLDTLELEDCSPLWETVLGSQPSSSIADFLQTTKGKSLTTIKIRDCHFDTMPVFGALKDHPNLKTFEVDYDSLWEFYDEERDDVEAVVEAPETVQACLDVIKNHNTKLVKFAPWEAIDPRIKYHLELNRCGLAKVRTNTDRVDELVDLLVPLLGASQWKHYWDRTLQDTANGETYSSFLSQEKGDALQAGLVYGLLRQNPGLLCHCPGTRSGAQPVSHKKEMKGPKRKAGKGSMERIPECSPLPAAIEATCGCWPTTP